MFLISSNLCMHSSCTPCHGCIRGTVSESLPQYPQDLSKSPPHSTADGETNSTEQDLNKRSHTLELRELIQHPLKGNHTVGGLRRRFQPKICCFIESACTSNPKSRTMRVNESSSNVHSVGGACGREIFSLAEPAGSNLVAHDA